MSEIIKSERSPVEGLLPRFGKFTAFARRSITTHWTFSEAGKAQTAGMGVT